MSFLSNSPRGKSGLLPLSPSPGLFQRAETTLLNKLAFLSTTTGRFCSWCHLVCFPHCFVVPIYYHGRERQSRKKSCERGYPFFHGNTAPAFLAVPYKTAAGISSGSCWFRGGGIRQALPWLRQSSGRIPGRWPCRLRSGSAGERGHRRCQGRRTAGGFP